MVKGRSGGFPDHVEVTHALTVGARYAGVLPVSRLPRLKAAVASPDTELNVDLRFERDRQGHAWLRGGIQGALTLTCQRGLHPYAWALDLHPELRLVASEADEARLLKDCEPCFVDNDRLALREQIEDEVLLALPMTPRCGDPDCGKALGKGR